MDQARGVGATAQLSALRERVDLWREHREGGRSPVPEELWAEAVVVAQSEGVYRTSKVLGFGYASLKERLVRAERRCARAEKKKAKAIVRAATFVEIPPLPSGGASLARAAITGGNASAGGNTVVELIGTRGARMRIDVTGASTVDVVGLAQAFWSRES